MRIVPLMDRVLIKQIEIEQKTGGGILLAGAETKKPHLHGEVLALGPGKQKATGEYVPIPFEVGDKVIYGNVSSTLEDVQYGEPVFLVEQNAIVALIQEGKGIDSPHATTTGVGIGNALDLTGAGG